MVIEATSLRQLGVPVLAVDENGRITSWNRYAAEYFRLQSESVIGREWHGVIRSPKGSARCPLCRTRAALRQRNIVPPLDSTILVGGDWRYAVIVPIPATYDSSAQITFLIIDQGSSGLSRVGHPDGAPDSAGSVQVDGDRIINELTRRERDILACIARGLDARETATNLGISHATARNYVQRVLTKLGARNKAEAVGIAFRSNLITRHPTSIVASRTSTGSRHSGE